jgi:hypothetical protein
MRENREKRLRSTGEELRREVKEHFKGETEHESVFSRFEGTHSSSGR